MERNKKYIFTPLILIRNIMNVLRYFHKEIGASLWGNSPDAGENPGRLSNLNRLRDIRDRKMRVFLLQMSTSGSSNLHYILSIRRQYADNGEKFIRILPCKSPPCKQQYYFSKINFFISEIGPALNCRKYIPLARFDPSNVND